MDSNKLTIDFLLTKVPISWWIAAALLLVSTFGLGVGFSAYLPINKKVDEISKKVTTIEKKVYYPTDKQLKTNCFYNEKIYPPGSIAVMVENDVYECVEGGFYVNDNGATSLKIHEKPKWIQQSRIKR